jgi:hypothetical protein
VPWSEQTQFLPETGCKLIVPAKFFCSAVQKKNVQRTPPLQVSGDNARDYLCYKISCPKTATFGTQVQVEDQFGQRAMGTGRCRGTTMRG